MFVKEHAASCEIEEVTFENLVGGGRRYSGIRREDALLFACKPKNKTRF